MGSLAQAISGPVNGLEMPTLRYGASDITSLYFSQPGFHESPAYRALAGSPLLLQNLSFSRVRIDNIKVVVVNPVGLKRVSHFLSSFVIVLSRQLEGKDNSYEND